MKTKRIVTGPVPQSHLPFSPGIISGEYLFVSGQASVDDQGQIVNDTFEGECRRSFDNLKRIVEAAGATLDDAVQVRNYVGRQQDLASFNAIYREYFSRAVSGTHNPDRMFGDLLKFEVDAVIYVGK